ncbi:MAG TPA: TIR domain-containing protein [Nevskia sp.]|nr:TIR domain-containing protein [Nevskia sp.]
MQEESYKYWAFISYSHRDQAWAEWLHRVLETYRVPRRLAGRQSAGGILPRRLFPVFRDQDELPSSPNLSGAIDRALQQSRTLIVIASPHAAVSKWVDQEIARFRALGRGDRILCLIVDGEPHADLQPGRGLLECFPPALRATAGSEPIAADVRPGKDGRPLARLKLIAGLLGVELDELRRRELRRRRLRNLGLAALSIAAALALGGLWALQQREKREALAQQALRVHIETVYEKGRQELLAHNQARAAVYLNEAYRLGVDTPALRFMLGRAMRIVEAQRLAFQAGAGVTRMRFSPDARRLVTVGADNVARVWDAADGRKLFEFDYPAHSRVVGPRFSRDNRLLVMLVAPNDAELGYVAFWDVASGAQLGKVVTAPSTAHTLSSFDAGDRRVAYLAPDRSAQVAEVGSGRLLRRLEGRYSVVGFSRDGKRLLTGSADGTVEVRDGADLRPLRRFGGLRSEVVGIDDTEDGAIVAAAAKDGSIRAWRLADGNLRILAGHPSPSPWLIFSLDGTRLFTGAKDGVRVWSSSGALVYAVQSPASSDVRADISSDGRLLLLSSGARLVMQDIESGAELYTLDAHRGPALARDISDDDRFLATGGPDGRVVLWSLPAFGEFEYRPPIDPLHWTRNWDPGVAAAYDHAGRRLATGAADGRLNLWDRASRQLLRSVAADPLSVNFAAFSDDDRLLLSGGESSGVKLWQADDGRLLRGFDCDGKEVVSAELAHGGKYLAAAGYKGRTCVWDAASGALLGEFAAGSGNAPHFTADGRQLALGGHGRVQLWNVERRDFAWTAELPPATGQTSADIAAMDFSADGSRLLVAGSGREAYVLDARDGRVLQHLSAAAASNFLTARFDRSGRAAVLGDGNGVATLWRPLEGKVQELRGHVGAVRSAEFSPDGAFVLTGGRDGSVKVWDGTDGALLDTIDVHGSAMPDPPFQATWFSPDMRSILGGSTDGVVREWPFPQERRGPQQIDAILRCAVPWRLDGDEAAPATPAEAACRWPASGGAP